MNPNKVRLFVKSWCGWCREAEDWLQERGVAYETVNVSRDDEGFREMVRLSGQTKAPVIEVDGRILADFDADELAAWWEDFGPGKP